MNTSTPKNDDKGYLNSGCYLKCESAYLACFDSQKRPKSCFDERFQCDYSCSETS